MRKRTNPLRLNDQQRKTVEQNHNLIYNYLKNKNMDEEEWYDIVAIGLCQAAYYFDESVGVQFSTFAYKCINLKVSEELTHRQAGRKIPEDKIVSLNMEINTESERECHLLDIIPSPYSVEDEVITKMNMDTFIKKQSEKKRQILQLYEHGYDTGEIAKFFGDTKCNISEHRRFMKLAYKKAGYA